MRSLLAVLLVCLLGSLSTPARADSEEDPQDFEAWPPAHELFDREGPWRLESNDPPPPRRESTTPVEPSQPPARRWGDLDFDNPGVVRLEAYYVPVMGFHADRDPYEEDKGLLFPRHVKTGEGFGARLGFGPDFFNVGLLYLGTHHRERDAPTVVDAHSLFLDALLGGALNEGPIEFTLHFGLGVGGVIFDFEDHYDDTGGAALNLRLQTGLRIMEHVEFTAGGGWLLWGYPGETIGHGGFLTLGLTLRF